MQIYLPVPPDETFASPAGADDYENKIDPCSTRFSNETGGWGRGVFGEGGRGERRIDGYIKARQRRNEGGSFFVLSDAFEISRSTTPLFRFRRFTLDLFIPRLQVVRCRFCHAFGILFRSLMHVV